MELDVQRWTKLLHDLAVTRASHSGVSAAVFALQQEWSRAEANRLRLEVEVSRHRSASRATPAHEAGEASLREAAAQGAALDQQLAVLQAKQAELSARSGALQTVARECRSWARQHAIGLPGDDDAGPLMASVPGAPQGAREFGAGLIPGGVPPRTEAPPVALGRSSRGSRGRFSMAAPDLNLDPRVFNDRYNGVVR